MVLAKAMVQVEELNFHNDSGFPGGLRLLEVSHTEKARSPTKAWYSLLSVILHLLRRNSSLMIGMFLMRPKRYSHIFLAT